MLNSANESLADVHRGWGLPSDDELRWLLDKGVGEAAMLEPYPLGTARVRFSGRTFDIDPEGERALTFRATDRGVVSDLIAWQPRSGELASWRGVAFCIGDQDDLFNPATYFAGSALRVHRTPLDWLRANRDGICVVRPDLVHAYLRQVPRLSVADEVFARQVKAWLQPPKPTVELLVEVLERAQAA
jgi:hypothetical protein